MEQIIGIAIILLAVTSLYVYKNFVEPKVQQQRAVLAEQAQKELLEEHERGNVKKSNKKKHAPKKVVEQEKVPTVTKKEVKKETKKPTPAPTPSAKKVEKLTTPAVAPVAAPIAAPAPVPVPTPTVEVKATPVETPVTAPKESKDEEPKVSAKKAKKSAKKNSVPEPVKVAEPIKVAEPVKAAEPVIVAEKKVKAEKPANKVENIEKTKTVQEKPKAVEVPVVAKVAEDSVPKHEVDALRALLLVKEKEIATAHAQTEKTKAQVQELQKKIDADSDIVKAAKKSENKAQSIDSKLESLNYTNSLLVKQLAIEKENTKAAQEQALKASEESSVTIELEHQIQELQHDRAHLGVQLDRLGEMNISLKQELSRAENDINQVSRKSMEAEHRAEAILRERNEFHHKCTIILSEKDARIATLEAEYRSLEGELENTKLQVEQYAEAINHAEEVTHSQAETFEGEKHSLIDEIDMLRSQISQDSEKSIEKDAEIKRAQEEIKSLKEQVSKAHDDHKTLFNKHSEHATILSTKDSDLAAVKTELSKAQEEAKAFEAKILELQTTHATATNTQQEQFDHLTKELETSNSQITDLVGKQETLTSRIVELTEKASDNSKKAEQQSTELQKRIEDLQQEITVKESTHKLIVTEKKALVTELASTAASHESVKKAHDALCKEKEELATLVTSKSTEVETLNKEKESLNAELAAAIESKKVVDAELVALIEASHATKAELDAENLTLSGRIAELEKDLKEHKSSNGVNGASVHEQTNGEKKGKPATTSEVEEKKEESIVEKDGVAVATF
ncbi:hypothetical protein BGZ76_001990 [Entomortierella beljakovae]|nr:hypothetical protein BGZ76_001990 [Entomortierella beljakovae]